MLTPVEANALSVGVLVWVSVCQGCRDWDSLVSGATEKYNNMQSSEALYNTYKKIRYSA